MKPKNRNMWFYFFCKYHNKSWRDKKKDTKQNGPS